MMPKIPAAVARILAEFERVHLLAPVETAILVDPHRRVLLRTEDFERKQLFPQGFGIDRGHDSKGLSKEYMAQTATEVKQEEAVAGDRPGKRAGRGTDVPPRRKARASEPA